MRSSSSTSSHARRFAILLLLKWLAWLTLPAQRIIHVPADVGTIQAAIAAAQDGDTVLVSPGTYAERLNLLGKNITVTSGAKSFSEASATVIQFPGKGPAVVIAQGQSRSTSINGFMFQNIVGGVFYVTASPTISNNVFLNIEGCAVGIFNSNASPLITGNRIANGHTGGCGLLATGNNPALFSGRDVPGADLPNNELIISNNLIEGNSDTPTQLGTPTSLLSAKTLRFERNIIRFNNGLSHVSSSLTAHDRLDFTNNLIYGNTSHDISPESPVEQYPATTAGIYIDSGPQQNHTVALINNTIFGNYKMGYTGGGKKYGNTLFLNEEQSTIHLSVVNNIFGETSGDAPVQCYGYGSVDASDTVWKNNDLYNLGAPLGSVGCSNASPFSQSDLKAAPQFRNVAANDYYLADTSPLVSAGDSTSNFLPTIDIVQKNRITCGKVDVGAYQTHPHPPIALAATPDPVAGGSSVTFLAILTGNCNVPTGMVTFLDNGKVIGTGTLNGSSAASLSTSFLTVGTHVITATYPGDFNFEDSVSNSFTLTVTGLPTATTLAIRPNPAKAFQSITLTATVTDPYVEVTGTVTFTAGAVVLGTAPLISGIASITSSQLGAGTFATTATFNATTQFAQSSATVQLQVDGTASSTTLQSTVNPAFYAQAVTFVATVAQVGSASPPDGTVSFSDGTVSLGTVPLSGGRASFPTSTLGIGSHPITATFNGSKDANASTSAALTQVISPVNVALQLTATPNPAYAGQTVGLRLTAIANNGQAVSGTATFVDGRTALGSAPFTNGVAMLPVSTLSVGRHTVVATYVDPANGVGLGTARTTIEITPFDFTITSSATKLDIPHSGYAVIAVTLTPLGLYDRQVHLSCADLPPYALCSFERETTDSLGKGLQTVKLIVNANTLLQYGPRGTVSELQWIHWGEGVLEASLFCFGIRRRRPVGLIVLVLCLLGGLQGCSGKLPDSTPAGDYTMRVLAQDSAGTTHAVTLQMHVR